MKTYPNEAAARHDATRKTAHEQGRMGHYAARTFYAAYSPAHGGWVVLASVKPWWAAA